MESVLKNRCVKHKLVHANTSPHTLFSLGLVPCSEVLFILALKLIQSKIISQLFQEFLANIDFFFPNNTDFFFPQMLYEVLKVYQLYLRSRQQTEKLTSLRLHLNHTELKSTSDTHAPIEQLNYLVSHLGLILPVSLCAYLWFAPLEQQ